VAAFLALVVVSLAILAALLVCGGRAGERGEAGRGGAAPPSGAGAPPLLSSVGAGRVPALAVALLSLAALPLCAACGLLALVWVLVGS